jgi:hypothetical protein
MQTQVYYEEVESLQEDTLSVWKSHHANYEKLRTYVPRSKEESDALQNLLTSMASVSEAYRFIYENLGQVKGYFPVEVPDISPSIVYNGGQQ